MLGLQKDPRNNDMYWILGRDPIYEESEYELDYDVTQENKVAISPLKIDYNNYQMIETLENWLRKGK
jgi:broad specificity polyphosphatase/5'/3'-nucleotidase SurE